MSDEPSELMLMPALLGSVNATVNVSWAWPEAVTSDAKALAVGLDAVILTAKLPIGPEAT